MQENLAPKKHLVILGGGFGGINTFLNLKDHLKALNLKVTIVNKNDYFLLTPMLHEAATGVLPTSAIAKSIKNIIQGYDADFVQESVTKVNLQDNEVQTSTGASLNYDYLVIALGATTNFYGNDNAHTHSFTLKDLTDAEKIKNHILETISRAGKCSDISERKKLLNFVIVGGGLTGVEFVSELSALVSDLKDFPFKNEIEITLINSSSDILTQLPKVLRKKALNYLRKCNVKVLLDAKVTDVTTEGVVLTDGKVIKSQTVVWVAGVCPNKIEFTPAIELTKVGRISVDNFMQVVGHENVYAVGDIAGEGQMLAQIAVVQAGYVARNIALRIESDPIAENIYEPTDPKGLLISLGPWNGVGYVKHFNLYGFYVWFMWKSVCLLKTPFWQKRWEILKNWLNSNLR